MVEQKTERQLISGNRQRPGSGEEARYPWVHTTLPLPPPRYVLRVLRNPYSCRPNSLAAEPKVARGDVSSSPSRLVPTDVPSVPVFPLKEKATRIRFCGKRRDAFRDAIARHAGIT